MKAIPEGDLRSTAIEALCRVRRSFVGGGFGVEEARSTRRTEAPLSARRRPAKGPEVVRGVGKKRGGEHTWCQASELENADACEWWWGCHC
jgi:hypothetical protein